MSVQRSWRWTSRHPEERSDGGIHRPRRQPATSGTTTDTMITASGNMNQWAFIVPRLDLVVVVTGADNRASVPDFVIRDILPSVNRD